MAQETRVGCISVLIGFQIREGDVGIVGSFAIRSNLILRVVLDDMTEPMIVEENFTTNRRAYATKYQVFLSHRFISIVP